MGASKARKEARKRKFGTISSGEEADQEGPGKIDPSNANQPKKQRFIVFIGNLPYTATDASIEKHFRSIQPTFIRHRIDKPSGKSKGFAFLEFDSFDRLEQCLNKYHHSKFDDGVSPTRKLNVELTAGGGGAKSEGRRSKLRAKNEKLNEERKKRAMDDRKQTEVLTPNQESKANAVQEINVHPSRRSRVLDA